MNKEARTATVPYRYRVLMLLVLLAIVTHLDRVCISVAGKRIQDELKLTPTMWGWVVGAFTLAYGLFEVPAGAMGDKVGPRRVLTRIVLWWSVFTALTGAVSSYGYLLLVRFLFGAGEAGAYPNASLAISKWFPTQERGQAHGVLWMAALTGAALAPVLVVPIQMAYGWRTSFVVFAFLGVVWAGLWHWWFRDIPAEKPGVSKKELELIGAPSGRKAHVGLPWKEVLKKRNFYLLLFAYHGYCWGSYFYLAWLHTYLQKGRGFSEEEMKIYAVLPFAAGAVGSLLGGFVSDKLVLRFGLKIGRRVVGCLGLGLSSGCVLSAALSTNRYTAVLLLTLGCGLMNCMLPVAWAICLDIGQKHSGSVTGAMNMAGQVGAFISSVAFGYMVVYFGSYDKPLLPLAAMLLVGALCFWAIDPTEKLIAETA